MTYDESTGPADPRRPWLALEPETRELLYDAEERGMHVADFRADETRGGDRGGITSHRGVLQEGEYVDEDLMNHMLEEQLGFTRAEFDAVVRSEDKRSEAYLRRRAILVRKLQDAGGIGNMIALADALGCSTKTLRGLLDPVASSS